MRDSKLKNTLTSVVLLAAAAALVCGPRTAQAQALIEFDVPTANSGVRAIAAGPDGAIWFAEFDGNKIGRITTDGAITEYPLPTTRSWPHDIVAGPDGAMWFTEEGAGKIGRLSMSGVLTEFPIPPLIQSEQANPYGITAGADGNLWFAIPNANSIGRMTTTGVFTRITLQANMGAPENLATGLDGNVWFTRTQSNIVSRLTPGGTVTDFPLSNPSGWAIDVAAGPDGALWFTKNNGRIGNITTAGAVTEFAIPSGSTLTEFMTIGPDSALWFTEGDKDKLGRVGTGGTITEIAPFPRLSTTPKGIANGADGALWFTEATTNKIGRYNPAATTSPLVSSVLPTSRSVQVGSTATIFASIINSGSTALANCRISPVTPITGTFLYQTTNPQTNALTGTANTPVNIPAKGLQTFLVAMAATAPLSPTDVNLGYACDSTDAAGSILGVNTVLITFDANPVGDMIAVGVTPSNDGFARIAGTNGTGIFAVATTNVGSTTTLTARARLSGATMPLAVTLCETNAQAQCKAAAAATVARSFAHNETATFSVFLKANGAIPADPAHFRVFLEFVDGGGVVRGSTSTAVTTQ